MQTRDRLGEAGIEIGGQFWSAFAEYPQGKAPLDLQLHPRSDFDPALMPFLDFKEQLTRLGFQLQVAGVRVSSADLRVSPTQLADFITPPPPPKPAPRIVRAPQDLEIPLNMLELAADFAGKQVEVVRKVGARLQGRLLEAGPRRLTLMTQRDGGEVLYHLQRSELDSVTVLAVPAEARDQFQKRVETQAAAAEEATAVLPELEAGAEAEGGEVLTPEPETAPPEQADDVDE